MKKFTFNPKQYNTSFKELKQMFKEDFYFEEHKSGNVTVFIPEATFREEMAYMFTVLGVQKKSPMAPVPPVTLNITKRKPNSYKIQNILSGLSLLAIFLFILFLFYLIAR